MAIGADGAVAGSVLLGPRLSLAWRESLGIDCSALSALGVAVVDYRRLGLAKTLVAYALNVAKDRGPTSCYIN